MRIDNRNYAAARLVAVVTVLVVLVMIGQVTAESQASTWPWVRYVALGVAALLAVAGVWAQRRLVLIADFDEQGIVLYTIRGRVERSWNTFDRAVISLRKVGPLQVVMLTLVGKDRKRFNMAIRETHWRQLSQIESLASKVELKS